MVRVYRGSDQGLTEVYRSDAVADVVVVVVQPGGTPTMDTVANMDAVVNMDTLQEH